MKEIQKQQIIIDKANRHLHVLIGKMIPMITCVEDLQTDSVKNALNKRNEEWIKYCRKQGFLVSTQDKFLAGFNTMMDEVFKRLDIDKPSPLQVVKD